MAEPTLDDPFGERPDPTSVAHMMEQLIDARIERRLTGHNDPRLKGVEDMALVRELLVRGWAVFRPKFNEG